MLRLFNVNNGLFSLNAMLEDDEVMKLGFRSGKLTFVTNALRETIQVVAPSIKVNRIVKLLHRFDKMIVLLT